MIFSFLFIRLFVSLSSSFMFLSALLTIANNEFVAIIQSDLLYAFCVDYFSLWCIVTALDYTLDPMVRFRRGDIELYAQETAMQLPAPVLNIREVNQPGCDEEFELRRLMWTILQSYARFNSTTAHSVPASLQVLFVLSLSFFFSYMKRTSLYLFSLLL